MEFFFPGGFAHDYEYTTRALGMVHYGFWGDRCVHVLHALTCFTEMQFLVRSRVRTCHRSPIPKAFKGTKYP